jgi:glyoxylase-like metal-dependent hydrolase (beta-lactamase superfamily II)
MPPPPYAEIADGIYCIDTGIYRHGLVASYLVRSNDRLAFIETGTARSVPRLLQVVASIGLSPVHVDYVIPTHVHLDHAGGAGRLMAQCPNARLLVHPKGAAHMIDPAKLTAGAKAVYGEEAFEQELGALLPVPPERVEPADDGAVFDLAGRGLAFLDTPGHANHHSCILDARTAGVFTGDTFGISYRELDTAAGAFLFAPTTPVAFDPDAWEGSLERIMGYHPQALYLTHFGRLEAPNKLVWELRQSIRDLAAIALAEEDHTPEGRLDRLRKAVADHLTARAKQHGVTMGETAVQDLLALDIDLNAQGLEVWLVRRARRNASEDG